MKLILQAAPQIGEKYAIIVNQCGPAAMQCSTDLKWKREFEAFLMADVPEATKHIFYLPRRADLDDQRNLVVDLGDAFNLFVRQVPAVHLQSAKVWAVNPDDYEALVRKMGMQEWTPPCRYQSSEDKNQSIDARLEDEKKE